MTEHALLPPQDIEAEKSVLGSILLDESYLPAVRAVIGPDDFYSPVHQDIYRVRLELADENTPSDLVTLPDQLRDRGMLDRLGGTPYLIEVAATVPSIHNAVYYALVVKKQSVRRQIITACNEATSAAYNATDDVADILTDSIGTLRELARRAQGESAFDLDAIAREIIAEMEHGANTRRRWPTGIESLDAAIGGLEEGTSITVGGRSGHCKTALAVQCCLATLAVERGVLILLYEDTELAFVRRLASQACGYAYAGARLGTLPPHEALAFQEAVAELSTTHRDRLWIGKNLRQSQIEAAIREHQPSLVVVDTLQKLAHLDGNKRASGDRHDLHVGGLTAGLAALAAEYGVCMMTLSQVSRRSGRTMPTQGDLRESGSIEEDSDVILLLWWPKRDHPQKAKSYGFRQRFVLDVVKNRTGGVLARRVFAINEQTQHLSTLPPEEQQRFLAEIE